MKHRNEMMPQHFLQECKKINNLLIKEIDKHNHTYNSKLLLNNIFFIKATSKNSNQSISIYYLIHGNYIDKSFINNNKVTYLNMLKKKIKLKKFPFVKFIYDKTYENILNMQIKNNFIKNK
ncbi:hypothetical protein AB837_00090 [bacterium AB1]|nr:hypothetical protein AB837_00090 [bacterium AB1]